MWDTEDDEDDDIVARFRCGGCSADADSKGTVSVTMVLIVVVLVTAGRFVTCGGTEGCACGFAETLTGVCGDGLSL